MSATGRGAVEARGRRAAVALGCALACLVALPAVSAAAGSPPVAPSTVGLELFVHPLHGGGWSSHELQGASAGAGAPSVAASKGGTVLLAQRTASGDVTASVGTMFGAFATTDLTAALGAPAAAGRPTAWVTASGVANVWYRTTDGDLEVATRSKAGTWAATDVTVAIGGEELAGDVTVVAKGTSSMTGYAVTTLGTVVEVSSPQTAGGAWTELDPTGGLPFAPLAGTLDVLRAPGFPAATVLLAVAQSGDVVELSDELAGPPAAVGPWHATDLSALGAPVATGAISGAGSSIPVATYPTWSDDAVALTLTSGLPGGFATEDLTRVSELDGARYAAPTLVAGPGGPAVAERALTGDLLLGSVASPTVVSDLSFQPHTAELVASDAGATSVGGAVVLVAADERPIAPTALGRRIAIVASSFDQQHRGFQTTPHGSDCNPFTASFGRGSTAGCSVGNASEEWCSDFAQYVWRAAGVATGGISAWSASFVTWGQAHHRVQLGTHFTAQVGDAIVWGQRRPLYGTHVAIVVSTLGKYLDVVSGNAGGDFPGFGVGVWRWGPFVGRTSVVNGYKVLGVVQP